MTRATVAVILASFALTACGPQRPAIDPALGSGVTSSNGGGVRSTGGLNQIDVGPNGARPAPSDQAGRAY